MLCVRQWSDAGTAFRVKDCRKPKTGQQKVELYYKDNPLCPSSYIIHLCPLLCDFDIHLLVTDKTAEMDGDNPTNKKKNLQVKL